MKQNIQHFLDSKWFNWIVLFLTTTTIFSVTMEIIFAQTFDSLDQIELLILVIFTIEFCLNLWLAEDIPEYIVEGDGIVDFLSILSGITFIKALEAVRVLRALRIVRIFKVLGGINGKAFNSIILLQVFVAISFSILLINTCHIRADSYFSNIEQLLYLYVLLMVSSTGFVIKIVLEGVNKRGLALAAKS